MVNATGSRSTFTVVFWLKQIDMYDALEQRYY